MKTKKETKKNKEKKITLVNNFYLKFVNLLKFYFVY